MIDPSHVVMHCHFGGKVISYILCWRQSLDLFSHPQRYQQNGNDLVLGLVRTKRRSRLSGFLTELLLLIGDHLRKKYELQYYFVTDVCQGDSPFYKEIIYESIKDLMFCFITPTNCVTLIM